VARAPNPRQRSHAPPEPLELAALARELARERLDQLDRALSFYRRADASANIERAEAALAGGN
jgi:hypothetical protein